MAASSAVPSDTMADRMRVEIDRAIRRNLKGFGYLGSPDPAVGQTPKTLLHRRGTLSLYHYKPMVKEVYRVPILFVMATTNKAYIFDLTPGQSLMEFLLKRGHDIYVMDWNPPTGEERYLKLENYVLDFIPDCLQRVQQHSGVDDVTVVAYCFGGVLSTIYAALHTDGPRKNLVCFTTPIDWSKMTLFRQWTDARHFDIDRLVDTVGIIQPEIITAGFDMLRPAGRIAGQVRLWDNLWNDEYVAAFRRMERWGNETLPLAGEYFRQMIKELMQKNGLYEGTLQVGGKAVDLKNIKVPLLHLMAQYDHIVPPEWKAPDRARRLAGQRRGPLAGRPCQPRRGCECDQTHVAEAGSMVGKAINMNDVSREYPRTVSCNGAKTELRLMSAGDTADLKIFIASLPEHDLLFLSRDITHPKVIEAWVAAIPEGRVKSLVALENGVIVGCTAIVLHELSWSRHVGELRVLVSPSWRGKGLGRVLIQECFAQALELGLAKLCVQMTVDQRAAIVGFEGIGFRAEALFRNHVKDRDGKLHDLAVLSHDIGEVESMMHAYGISDAVGA